MPFGPHLIEDALGNVVVAPPISGAFGIGELIKIVSASLVGQSAGSIIDRRSGVDEMATSAEPLDRLNLLRLVDRGMTAINGNSSRCAK